MSGQYLDELTDAFISPQFWVLCPLFLETQLNIWSLFISLLFKLFTSLLFSNLISFDACGATKGQLLHCNYSSVILICYYMFSEVF